MSIRENIVGSVGGGKLTAHITKSISVKKLSPKCFCGRRCLDDLDYDFHTPQTNPCHGGFLLTLGSLYRIYPFPPGFFLLGARLSDFDLKMHSI